MGEVAVLRPQDLFSNHHHNNLISPALKSQSLGRRYSDPAPTATHTANKHRSSFSSSNRWKRSHPKNNNNNSLVMGQVKLLKRGETLPQPLRAAPPAHTPAPSSKDDNKVVPMMKKQQLQKIDRVPGDKKKEDGLGAGSFRKTHTQGSRLVAAWLIGVVVLGLSVLGLSLAGLKTLSDVQRLNHFMFEC